MLKTKTQKAGKILIITAIAFYYFFSASVTVDLILKPLEGDYKEIKESELPASGKVVLLLGAGKNNVLRASEILRIYHSRPALDIILSGTDDFDSNLAEEVKKYLTDRGIPQEKIFLENKSLNTFESGRNIKDLLGEEQFLLVTSAYHMRRSMEVFKKLGMNPVPAPTDFKAKKQHRLFDFFPGSYNFEKSDLAVHEYFGILFYKLRYY